jgi:hypothetical protein
LNYQFGFAGQAYKFRFPAKGTTLVLNGGSDGGEDQSATVAASGS